MIADRRLRADASIFLMRHLARGPLPDSKHANAFPLSSTSTSPLHSRSDQRESVRSIRSSASKSSRPTPSRSILAERCAYLSASRFVIVRLLVFGPFHRAGGGQDLPHSTQQVPTLIVQQRLPRSPLIECGNPSLSSAPK